MKSQDQITTNIFRSLERRPRKEALNKKGMSIVSLPCWLIVKHNLELKTIHQLFQSQKIPQRTKQLSGKTKICVKQQFQYFSSYPSVWTNLFSEMTSQAFSNRQCYRHTDRRHLISQAVWPKKAINSTTYLNGVKGCAAQKEKIEDHIWHWMTEGRTDPPTGTRGLTEIPHPRACCCAHLPLTSLRQRQKKATPQEIFKFSSQCSTFIWHLS